MGTNEHQATYSFVTCAGTGRLALFRPGRWTENWRVRLELTRRADYGVRAMLALARHGGEEPLSASRIADAMAIPPRFVGQVMGDLVEAGLVEARTGRSGGYRLIGSPADITILTIVEATEGDSRRRTCVLRNAPCSV